MSTLEIRGLTAGYGPTQVLHGVDLDVEEGTTTAVLGASGCGKSTLLRAVAGFVRPTGGEVRVGGAVVAGPDRHLPPERRGVGYVRQDGGLFPHLDVAGNVAFGWGRRRRGRSRHAEVASLLELVGLDPELGRRRPDELSGGQQQRVALARALALEPRLVLLDEPFSSLDTALRAQTREAVAAALAARGATTVLVTHDQGEALSFADQVAILREGRFTSVGAPREVYETPADPADAVFVGEALHLPGRLEADGVSTALGLLAHVRPLGGPLGSPLDVVVRPEQLTIGRPGEGSGDARVERTVYYGHDAVAVLRLDGDERVVSARIHGSDLPAVGTRVSVRVEGPVGVYPRR